MALRIAPGCRVVPDGCAVMTTADLFGGWAGCLKVQAAFRGAFVGRGSSLSIMPEAARLMLAMSGNNMIV